MKILLTMMLFAGVGYGQTRLDGRWWNEAQEHPRDGVVDGLFDCLKWDCGKELPYLSHARFKEEISMFYKRKPLDTSIAQVLLSLPKSPQKPRAGGEDYSNEKHGYFDGDYWGSSSVEQQNGFVTGYLFCRTGLVPKKGLVNDAVQRISKWLESSAYAFLTAKERDSESNLDYFEARYYSGAQRRFTSPDEFTGGPDELYNFAVSAAENPTFYADLADPQSLNKYQYCYNNPYLYVDPDGHGAISDFLKGIPRGFVASTGLGHPANRPNQSDSNASLAGQLAGSVLEGLASQALGGQIAGTGVATTVGTGGAGAVLGGGALVAAGGAVAVAGTTGALANINAIGTIHQSSASDQTGSGGSQEGNGNNGEAGTMGAKDRVKTQDSVEKAQTQADGLRAKKQFLDKRGKGEGIKFTKKIDNREIREIRKKYRSTEDLDKKN